MGAIFSKVRPSENVEEYDGSSSQIEERRTRQRSAVELAARNAEPGQAVSRQEPEDENADSESDSSKSSKINDNICSDDRKWDYAAGGCLIVGTFVVTMTALFGIPAIYKLIHK